MILGDGYQRELRVNKMDDVRKMGITVCRGLKSNG